MQPIIRLRLTCNSPTQSEDGAKSALLAVGPRGFPGYPESEKEFGIRGNSAAPRQRGTHCTRSRFVSTTVSWDPSAASEKVSETDGGYLEFSRKVWAVGTFSRPGTASEAGTGNAECPYLGNTSNSGVPIDPDGGLIPR
jgi:hypothetical protein